MSIELLVKLHAPRAASIEAESQRAGRSPEGTSREEVLAALAHADRLHPVGVMVLRARHLGDGVSLRQLVGSYPPSAVMSVTGLQGTVSDCCASTSATTPMGAAKRSGPGSWSCWGITRTQCGCEPSSSLAVSGIPRGVVAPPAPVPVN